MSSRTWMRRAGCGAWVLAACGSPSDGVPELPTSGAGGAGGAASDGGASGSAAAAASGASSNQGVVIETSDSGDVGSFGGSEGPPTPTGLEGGAQLVPCEVAEIVREHCITCHDATPKFSAPMSLVEAGDFAATAPISGEPVSAAALRRVNAEGGARMPPPGTVDALDATELATLSAWLEGGGLPVTDGCEIAGGVAPGSSDVEGLLPRPERPGSFQQPYEGWDADVTCYPFTSFATSGDKSSPYAVGTAIDTYVGFGFVPPWEGTRYVRAFRAITDNTSVLHHWILFQEPGVRDGSVQEVVGAHPGGQMLHGWAPGGTDLYFTPDLGMRMEGSESFLLEVHYNSNDGSAVDASGAEVCVTETPPENEVAISWLGTDAINGTSASGTCRPASSEPIHIVGGNPHMHLKGQSMQVVLTRAGGGTEMIHDAPFSFENQRGYPEDVVINPGDSITTTCQYSSPARFGRGTSEEMCYWFALAYPAGALADNGFLGSLLHGPQACLGI